MNCFDVYRVLFGAVDSYMDNILLKEDPTDSERKDYEDLKYWRAKAMPDDRILEIFKRMIFNLNRDNDNEQKE